MTSIRNKIEKGFESLARVVFHHRLKTLLIMFIIIGALLSQLPKLTMDISTEGFLHPTDPTLTDYNAFRDQFGRDELIVVAITCPDVFNGRFLEKLKKLHEDLRDTVPYLEDITSLVNARNTRGEADRLIVEDLLENWPETPEAMAVIKKRTMENPLYKNLLISENGRMTTIVLQAQTYSAAHDDMDVLEGFEEISDMAPPDVEGADEKKYLTDSENSEMVTAVEKIANSYATPDFTIDIAGSSVVTHFLKHAMIQDIRKFLLLAVITVALFLFIMFRRISGVVLPLLIVMLSLLSTVSLMAIFKVPIKLPTQILPSFMLAMSVGYSVHILAIFYHSFQESRNREAAIVYAIGHSGLAVLMTGATTAGGLFSFSTSQVAPIGDLGIFAGSGVLLAMVYTIILLPALLALIPIKIRPPRTGPAQEPATDRLLATVGRIATTHPYKILIISAAILAVSTAGAMKIKFSHDVLKWLPKDNAARIATEKIDHDLKGSVALEIILDTGRENGLYDPALLNRIEKTIAYLETLEIGDIFVGKAWSLTTILKETHRALNENRPAFYTISRDRNLIAQELLLFENSGSDDMEDFTDSQFSKVRIMAKVPFENAVAYGAFLKTVNHHLQETFPDEKITLTGMAALFSGTISNAIDSMGRSYLYALLVITVLMVLLIGRLRIGLLSMVPNLTPIIIILGIMGWLKIPMNLFTMLVGNIAIGLAVDDTIHFMHNFRRYFEKSNDATAAVMETLLTTGRAMLVTSCVLSVGFFIFMFATMNNLFHFGLLTGLTIILALLSDYFIAPALMVVVNSKKTGKRRPIMNTETNLLFIPILMIVTLIGFSTASAGADDPKARAIMEKVDARDDGDNQVSDMEMVLIDKNGKQRLRKLHTFSKDKGEDTLKLMFFQHPADVKDTSFLTVDYDDPDKDDDQWLYLPALKKTKRIASTDKSGSFMGSDLTYSDMTSRNLEDYDYTFFQKTPEKEVNGVKTWVIWSTPRSKEVVEETGYEKSLLFVRQDNFFVVRALHWVRDGGYLKYMDVRKLDKINGIWVATEMHITQKKAKETVHKTILKFDNVKFNQDLTVDLFSVRTMEKGF